MQVVYIDLSVMSRVYIGCMMYMQVYDFSCQVSL